MFEPVIIQLAKEAGVPLVVEILGANLRLKHHWHMNLERSTMGHPGDPLFILGVRQNVMNLLGKGHILDLRGMNIALLRRNLREISIGVVHRPTWGLDDLDYSRFHRKLRLFVLASSLVTVGVCLDRKVWFAHRPFAVVICGNTIDQM